MLSIKYFIARLGMKHERLGDILQISGTSTAREKQMYRATHQSGHWLLCQTECGAERYFVFTNDQAKVTIASYRYAWTHRLAPPY